MTKIKSTLNIGILAIFLAVTIVSVQQIHATGCPTDFVSEHIKNAKAALQNGTTEEVLNELQLAEEAIGIASEEKE
jgi:hypothetical protein